MGIDISNLNPKTARVHSALIYRIHKVSTRRGITTTSQLPLGPNSELTNTSGDNGVARQYALIGDP